MKACALTIAILISLINFNCANAIGTEEEIQKAYKIEEVKDIVENMLSDMKDKVINLDISYLDKYYSENCQIIVKIPTFGVHEKYNIENFKAITKKLFSDVKDYEYNYKIEQINLLENNLYLLESLTSDVATIDNVRIYNNTKGYSIFKIVNGLPKIIFFDANVEMSAITLKDK